MSHCYYSFDILFFSGSRSASGSGSGSGASSAASSAASSGNGAAPTSADSADEPAPVPAPTVPGTTPAPVVSTPAPLATTPSPVQGPPDGIISTNTTISFVVNPNNDPSAPTAPNDAELAVLETRTFEFFNDTLFAGFPERYRTFTPGDFTDMMTADGWSITFFAETGFTPIPTTDEVKVVIESGDYSDYILNYVIPAGPYFAFSSGLQLDSEASVKQ